MNQEDLSIHEVRVAHQYINQYHLHDKSTTRRNMMDDFRRRTIWPKLGPIEQSNLRGIANQWGVDPSVSFGESSLKPLTYRDICTKLTHIERSIFEEAEMIPCGRTSPGSTDHYITKIVEGKRLQLFTDESYLNEQQLRVLMRSLVGLTIRGGTTVAPGSYAGLVIEWTR